MERHLLVFLVFFIFGIASAQTDAVLVEPAQDTVIYKEAPDVLKDLLETIIKEEELNLREEIELEIDGLLIDETMTKSGSDFYDFFYRDWEAPEGARNYTVFITERPFRVNMTMIELSINETLIIQTFLQPRLEYIEELAAESVLTVHNYLSNFEAIKKELEGDERSGSGIF